jgi:peptidoglycan hydrolase-like protein with peptidoglycan-binding domain
VAERGRWLLAGLVAVAVLGTAGAVAMTRVDADRKADVTPRADPPETVEVVKGDIADQQSVTGSLAYGAEHTLTGRRPGTLTAFPAPGTVVDRGKPVYWVDAKPVPLFHGTLPLYRDLAAGMTDGPDVKQVEENLVALGHTGFGTPDEKYTNATATAVKQWQKANGLDRTGGIAPGDVVVEPAPIRVASVTAQLGAPATADLMKVSGTDRVVTAEIDKGKQRFAKVGAKVDLTIADGAPTTGTVTAVTPGTEPTNPGEKPKLILTVALDDPASAADQDAVAATILFTLDKRQGVLIVPVGALLALAEGGYAVEKADGGTLIPVKTGLFAKGRVEVTGAGLTEGARVVTTS